MYSIRALFSQKGLTIGNLYTKSIRNSYLISRQTDPSQSILFWFPFDIEGEKCFV